MCNWVTVTLLVGLIARSIYNWLILLVLWKVERRGAPWISSEKSNFSGRISHIWQMRTTCSSRNPRNVLLKIIIVFGCHVWMYHIHSPKSCGSKFEAIRQQGFIHRRPLDEKVRCEEPQWYDIRCFPITQWSKYMAQSPKGRLIHCLYKPIHGNCAIYFYLGVGAKNFPQKWFLNFGIFAMKNLSGVNWLTGQLGYRGANWSLKKGRNKKNGAWWIHTLQGSRTIPSMVMVYLPTCTIKINHSWTGKDAKVPWMVWVNWLSPTATSSNLLSWRFSHINFPFLGVDHVDRR